MDALRDITYLAVILRIFAAALLGGLMGLERGLKNRAAGLRTYMLVCTGACLIMLTNQYIFSATGTGDPVRLGAQVVSGIGFLGAGTIIVTRRSQIKGLTTAAGLWATAGIGLALGIGFYEGALCGFAAFFIAMAAMQRMDNKMHSKTKTMDVYFELTNQSTLGSLLQQVREMGIEISELQREPVLEGDATHRAFTATLRVKKRTPHVELLEQLLSIDAVSYAESLN